jgi:hypothetical protein
MGFQRHDVKNGSRFLGRDEATNRMLTGGTQTIILRGNTSGEKDFEAGKVLKDETVPVDMDGTNGWVYDSSNDYYKVKIGTTSTVKTVNMYGEEATFAAHCFLKGAKVVVNSNTFPEYSGTYSLVEAAVVSTNCFLYLAPDSPRHVFGDADLGVELPDITATANDNKINVTVLPFSPAFCVEMLGVDGVDAGTDDARTTPATFRMNNIAGTREVSIDYPDGQVVYGEITHFTPQAVNTHYAILYCQATPSLEFSPYNKQGKILAAGAKGAPKAR